MSRLLALALALVPAIAGAQCIGPVACPESGTLTPHLGLCLPDPTQPGWAAALNANAQLLDAMFPGCALGPAGGGTGATHAPLVGDLLVGNNLAAFDLLHPGLAGQVLTSDTLAADKVSWNEVVSSVSTTAPAMGDCTAGDIGRVALDITAAKLWVCTAGGWKFAQLN